MQLTYKQDVSRNHCQQREAALRVSRGKHNLASPRVGNDRGSWWDRRMLFCLPLSRDRLLNGRSPMAGVLVRGWRFHGVGVGVVGSSRAHWRGVPSQGKAFDGMPGRRRRDRFGLWLMVDEDVLRRAGSDAGISKVGREICLPGFYWKGWRSGRCNGDTTCLISS